MTWGAAAGAATAPLPPPIPPIIIIIIICIGSEPLLCLLLASDLMESPDRRQHGEDLGIASLRGAPGHGLELRDQREQSLVTEIAVPWSITSKSVTRSAVRSLGPRSPVHFAVVWRSLCAVSAMLPPSA